MGVKDRSFWKGVNRTAVPAMQDVMQSELAKRLFKDNRQLVNIEQEEEDRMESKSLLDSINSDSSMTPEERQQFVAQFGDGKKGLSKEARERLTGSYNTLKTDKKKAADDTVKTEKAAAEKKAAAKMKYDALKAEAEALGPEAAKSLAGYMSMAEPNETSVDRFEKALERHYTATGKTPDNPNETETKIGLVKKATEIGGGDPYKGWSIIKEQDPTTYYEAQQRGIKTEREDKASPKAEKLLEDVQGEWQYEKDQYTAALTKAQKDPRVAKGDLTPEQVVMEAGISDPGPITLFAFKYLGDRKGYMNEEAANEAFKRLATQTPEGQAGMKAIGEIYGTGGKPAAAATPGAPAPGVSPGVAGTVSAGQEQSLIAEEERWKTLLDAAEAKYGIKK